MIDPSKNSDLPSRKESFARLSANCRLIHLWLFLLPEDNEMTLDDLKKMSTADLTKLYNEHADKQVKRMETRAKLEERTIQKLREAGKWEDGSSAGDGVDVSSDAPAKTPKAGKPSRPPIEAPATTTEEGTADMAKTATNKKTATKKAPAKKAAPKKEAATKKPAAPKKEGGGKRGAPLTDHVYVAISEKSKDFNPRGYKPQAESMRNKVYQAIKGADEGLTRTQLEKKFSDLGNVKAQIDVLVKLAFIKAK